MTNHSKHGVRWDIAAALSAALVGACALFVSIYQVRLMRAEQATSIWPYLVVGVDNQGGEFSLAVLNLGVGPAVIKSAVLLVAGKPVLNWKAAQRIALPDHEIPFYTETPLNRWVFPAGAKSRIYVMPNSTETAPIREVLLNSVIDLCYCSLRDECWTLAVSPGSPNLNRRRQQCVVREQVEFEN